MLAQAFGQDASGQLVRTDGNHLAFLPDLLPPRRQWSPLVWQTLSHADRAIGRLDGIARQIEHPEHLFRNFLRREAVLSSRIEGTKTTIAGLAYYEASIKTESNRDAREVNNYVEALEYALKEVQSRRLSRGLFNELHQILMRGRKDVEVTPGFERDCQVQISAPRLTTLDDARFVPPPASFVPELLDNLIAYLANDDDPPLIKLAIAHYQFEAIHPYRDGNGRLGRLLFSAYLMQQRILTAPMLYISPYLERHKEQYYDALLDVSRYGAWEAWVLFILESMKQQADDTVIRTSKLGTLRKDYSERLRATRKSSTMLTLVDDLFTVPVLSVPMIVARLDVTYPSGRRSIDKLIDAGVLRDSRISGGTQYWLASEIIETLDASLDGEQLESHYGPL